jgi:hypothetical protein
LRSADQGLAVKTRTEKKRRAMFEKHLSFQLKYAYESYARTLEHIELKLKSETERLKVQQHAKDSVQIWTKALADFKQLAGGKGTTEELETFKMFFHTKSYYTAEEMPQTKLFSFD